MTKLDTIDKKIVAFLQDDGTLTNAEIALRLGTSEATIRRRRSRLQDDDIIRIVAVADPFKLGFEVIAIIGVQTQSGHLGHVEQALKEMPEVRFLGVTLGTYDLILEAWFRSNDELLRFITVTLAGFEGVQRTESFQIMRLSKYTYDWGQPAAARQALPGKLAPAQELPHSKSA
jgi:Lrp/AsnC family transcriptional regulator for asnA, asnC and gidA